MKKFDSDAYISEIAQNRARILDQFCTAYIASRSDCVSPEKVIKRLKLVERRNANSIEWSFELKRGPLKKQNSV